MTSLLDQQVRAVAHEDRDRPSDLASALTNYATDERVRLACRQTIVERLELARRNLALGYPVSVDYLLRRCIRDIGGAL